MSKDLTRTRKSGGISGLADLGPVFDPVTGYLALVDGRRRQVIARVEDGVFYVVYKRDGQEYPMTLDDLMLAYLQSKT